MITYSKSALKDRLLRTLQTVLRRMRDDVQGGYHDVHANGKFSGGRVDPDFRSTSIGHVSARELDDLFTLADIKPDAVKVNGNCRDCVYGNHRGGDLGWSRPCCSCARPKMTNFVPLAAVTARELIINDHQDQFLKNVKNLSWWATNIIVPKEFDDDAPKAVREKREKPMDKCYATQDTLTKRGMMADGMGTRYLTNKGLLALKRHKS
jgi:hypothetical protein